MIVSVRSRITQTYCRRGRKGKKSDIGSGGRSMLFVLFGQGSMVILGLGCL